jgi:carbonic anhydrase
MLVSAAEALARLHQGNGRHVTDKPRSAVLGCRALRNELATEQHPFAVVLGCADSRAPAEIVFDQDVGDLFVIRVAGHVVAPAELGSIEMAAEELGVRLVVVMGHSGCAAIDVTLEQIRAPNPALSRNVAALVDPIRPSVLPVLEQMGGATEAEITEAAVRANIFGAVRAVQSQSPVLTRLIRQEGLLVVGAEYHLETGVVEFFTPA